MKHRFRYLDERGQQVEVKDLEALREHVRAGRVDDDTLLYDSLTDEWAPASAHSAYRLMDARATGGSPEGDPEGAESSEGASSDDGGSAKTGVRSSAGFGSDGLGSEPDFPDLDITLAPDEAFESTDEVVEKLLRERERDGRVDRIGSSADDFTRAPDASEESEGSGEGDESAKAPDRRGTRPSDPWGSQRRARGPQPPDPDDEPIARPRSVRRRKAPASPRGGKGRIDFWSLWKVEVPGPLLVLIVGVASALALYSVTRVGNPSSAAEASTGGDRLEEAVVSSGSNSVWAAAEGGAFQDMLEGVDSLRSAHSVERIPRDWLSGPYLADAERFAAVREYWIDYQGFVDAVRSQDTALFRRSFVRRLEEQGVSGPISSIRLAGALESFRESQPARDTVYERMEDLAESALDLHDLLVDRSDDIVYDPVTEDRASRQPILEAWSEDAYLRRSIWALLDRITANLALLEYDDPGAGDSDLTERLFQELRNRSLAAAERGG